MPILSTLLTRGDPSSQFVDLHGIRKHEGETVTAASRACGWVLFTCGECISRLGSDRTYHPSIEHSSSHFSYPAFIRADERAAGQCHHPFNHVAVGAQPWRASEQRAASF